MDTINSIKVNQLISSRSGREIANQYKIQTPEGVYFQSYESIIAFIRKADGQTLLDSRWWDYSRTTSKYLNIFLGMDSKEVKRRVKLGEFKLINLNRR